ncbi:Hypothetical predicted protein [Mytilus galloprovincialis]|uniref:EF-hand domain-containing protein n=1 Tax=Mytilus galloprovincialis TaxID=29158 RepID=A0A8B6EME8_MYTGA|nr:Hypothetical predicted protein [Mytilus galloprovincialis]
MIENSDVWSKTIPTTSMSSGNIEFLREKWSYWFDSLDVNHDGKITKADVDFTLKQFPVVEGLNKKVGKLADDQIEKWWNTYILRGKHEISKGEFLDDFQKEYAEKKLISLPQLNHYLNT